MRSEYRHAIYGPPGTGKTHALVERAVDVLKKGLDPEQLVFVSFTKRSVQEARSRLLHVVEHEFPGARTLHSMAYKLLGLNHSEVLQTTHLNELAELTGNPLHAANSDVPGWEGTPGDRALAMWELARARCLTLESVYRYLAPDDLPWEFVEGFIKQYNAFKAGKQLVDFGDMITNVVAESFKDCIVFVDEAQDLSTAQWNLLDRLFTDARAWYVAGDDDQSIYRWSGADPLRFVRWQGTSEVLGKSHRLPSTIKQFSERLTQRMAVRVSKHYATANVGGQVQWVDDASQVDLSTGTWLLLARSKYQLATWRKLARQQGVVYTLPDGEWSWKLPAVRAAVVYERLRKGQSAKLADVRNLAQYLPNPYPVEGYKTKWMWEDLPFTDRNHTWMEALVLPLTDQEYLRALRRRSESLNQPGRVRIGTVHSVKGAEADHVALLTDVSQRVTQASQRDMDAELRVQYVGVTRAKQSLTLVEPDSPNHWSFL